MPTPPFSQITSLALIRQLMSNISHDFVSGDMRGMKAALVAHARIRAHRCVGDGVDHGCDAPPGASPFDATLTLRLARPRWLFERKRSRWDRARGKPSAGAVSGSRAERAPQGDVPRQPDVQTGFAGHGVPAVYLALALVPARSGGPG